MNPQSICESSKFFKFPEEVKISIFDTSEKENILTKSESVEQAAYKKKKTLKLNTNSNSNTSSEDPEKYKLFTPQPQNSMTEINILYLSSINTMSYPPSWKLKAKKSSEFHDFFYRDDVHEVVMKRCGHKSQEDRFCANLLKKRDPFFGVFDGHGNSLCSELLSEVFFKYIENQDDYEIDTTNAIKTACKKLDEELVSLLQKNNLKGGSTALMSLIKDHQLYVINVGDSIGALLNKEKAIQLNIEHTPQNEFERKKLDMKGAIVIEKNKTFRVLGELAVSRAFGDKNYKDYITAEPDISIFDLDQLRYEYLILASDGFWNMINLNELPSLYMKWLDSEDKKEYLGEFLMNEAETRHPGFKKDNMTMILVNLKNLDQMKEVVSASFGCMNQSKKLIPNQVCFEFNSDVD